MSEYAVVSTPGRFKGLNALNIIDFNYSDAIKSGIYFAFLKGDKGEVR